MRKLARQGLIIDPVLDWGTAFSRRGAGSAKVRAKDIAMIYDLAVSISDGPSGLETDEFIVNITELVREAIKSGEGKLIKR